LHAPEAHPSSARTHVCRSLLDWRVQAGTSAFGLGMIRSSRGAMLRQSARPACNGALLGAGGRWQRRARAWCDLADAFLDQRPCRLDRDSDRTNAAAETRGCAALFKQLADARVLVRTLAIHDHDVAGVLLRRQATRHPTDESLRVVSNNPIDGPCRDRPEIGGRSSKSERRLPI